MFITCREKTRNAQNMAVAQHLTQLCTARLVQEMKKHHHYLPLNSKREGERSTQSVPHMHQILSKQVNLATRRCAQ